MSFFSVFSGASIYEKLHITRERISLAVRLSLAHQVAQALAYLHAKKIVYKHLTSRNVYMEKQKATLSVINFSNMQKGNNIFKLVKPAVKPRQILLWL